LLFYALSEKHSKFLAGSSYSRENISSAPKATLGWDLKRIFHQVKIKAEGYNRITSFFLLLLFSLAWSYHANREKFFLFWFFCLLSP
jgi:hypothetical protein